MTQSGITIDDVFNACMAIKKKDEKPTIDRIRQYLNNRGSNTTISKYLNLWKDQKISGKKKTAEYYRGFDDAINMVKRKVRGIVP